MKKVILLLSIAVSALSANAQLYLTGASPYTQNFDGIGGGLPVGWTGNISSGPATLGTIYAFDVNTSFGVYDTLNTACLSSVLKGGFKNFPSADVCQPGDACTVQEAYANRAFGVRQASNTASTGPGFDSGAAFVLTLANTNGMTGVSMNFKLQSLDTTSPRVTTWAVQYGLGANPTTFTNATVTGGALTTGGKVFSNVALTANFGSALDNKQTNVIIRIVALIYSSGSGTRAATTIDDVVLSWTGTAKTGIVDVSGNAIAGLSVLGAPTTDNVNFNYDVTGNNNMLSIYDLTGRIIYTQAIDENSTQLSVNGLHLVPGMYIARIGNGQATGVAKFMVN